MGISFKVSKTGKRFQHKPLPSPIASQEEELEDAVFAASKHNNSSVPRPPFQRDLGENKGTSNISGTEVSFTLSLFPDGYSIAKPIENESAQPPTNVPMSLLPYDRASETLFSAIESGRLPADILDDIPGRYVDGALFCEVRDYRECFTEGLNEVSGDSLPIINRVSLRMSLENVVKDIQSLSDDAWTYGDMMEVESRILEALQPQLCLDPTPQFDRLSKNHNPTKLNFDIHGMRRKRRLCVPEVAVSSNNIHGKKICLDRAPESSKLGDSGSLAQQLPYDNSNTQTNVSGNMFPLRSTSIASDGSHLASSLAPHQSRYQIGVGSPRMMRDQQSGSLLNVAVASPGAQDMMIPFTDNSASSIHEKRNMQDGQSSPLANKKPRSVHTTSDGNLHNLGQQMDNSNISELQWKSALMQQQQQQHIGRGVQYAGNGMQKYSQQVFGAGANQEGGSIPFNIGQQGIRYNLKEEPVETDRFEKTDLSRVVVGDQELNVIDSQQARLQQRMAHQFTRSSFSQTAWGNLGQAFDNNIRKEDSLQKRKLVQSPRVSAGGLPQSPLSSKSGEISSGSIGPQFGAAVTSGLVQSQKEKSAATSSVPMVGVNTPFNSSAIDSKQRQNLAQATAKRRTNSLPKTPLVSGVGSPASVSTMSLPMNASSPPVGTQSLGDQALLEKFSKIEIVSMRHQINMRKNKANEYPIRKANSHSTQPLIPIFSNDTISENLNDETCEMPLSRSLVGGNVNVCKTRILNFVQTERVIQGNSFQLVPKARTRLIMSEKANDGSVAIYIGDIDDADYLAAEDYLPTLPNTHTADLLAAQFCSLMVREGYHVEDHVQPKPVRMIPGSVVQVDGSGIPSTTSEMHQFSEGVSFQSPNDVGKPSNTGNLPVGSSAQVLRMLAQGHPSSSQAHLPGVSMPSRPQQPEQSHVMQQQQQQQLQQQLQHPQFQRNAMMLPANSMQQHLGNISQNANMQSGPHMTAKPTAIQLQLMQQQQQQQQQPQMLQAQQQQQQQSMQRKMMSGLASVNNMVGHGGLGNVMGIGGSGRGVGGAGISGNIPSIGNMNQNPLSMGSASSLSNVIRAGTLTQAQANYMKLRMAQNRAQSSIGGLVGARQMHPGTAGLSMLGPALNRANQIQRAAMGQMGPPKLMPVMNMYMNQQQQQQLQQLQLQQQQQLQQSQDTSLPLQSVVSPPQMGSPSSIGVSHQMNQMQQQQQQQQQPSLQQASPQQMSQRTPMSPQLSSGPVVQHPMVATNAETCPASPQLSSQTLGSVGSISNSPMELQGVNKSNSLNNA